MRMPTRNHQRKRRHRYSSLSTILRGAEALLLGCCPPPLLPLLQQHRMNMPFQMIHRNQRHSLRKRQRLRIGDPHQQRPRQPRPAASPQSASRSPAALPPAPAPPARPAQYSADARGWPAPAPRRHKAHASQSAKPQSTTASAPALHHRRRRLIARRLNSQNQPRPGSFRSSFQSISLAVIAGAALSTPRELQPVRISTYNLAASISPGRYNHIQQIRNQQNQQNRPQADARATAISPAAIAVISTATAQNQNQQNDDHKSSLSISLSSFLSLLVIHREPRPAQHPSGLRAAPRN